MSKVIDFTAAYKAKLQGQEEDVVTITAPSGQEFQFRKPSTLSMLFKVGHMPQSAANGAVQAWIKAGVLQEGELTDDQAKQVDLALKLAERVRDLSVYPKLVVGPVNNPATELSTDDISDTDLNYLFNWVMAGGDESAMLRTFPAGQRSGALASASRKGRRNKAK